MGDWGIKIQMEAINEEIWFHKRWIHSFFSSIDILTNYLHRCRIDFTFEIIGDQI
jgi:hypothetical protein